MKICLHISPACVEIPMEIPVSRESEEIREIIRKHTYLYICFLIGLLWQGPVLFPLGWGQVVTESKIQTLGGC